MRRSSFLLCMLALGACTSDTFVGDDGGGDTGTVSGGDGSTDSGHMEGGKAEAGPTRYCDTVDAQFCADFDLPEDAGAGFGPPFTAGGWSLEFQKAQAKSETAVQLDILGDAAGAGYIDNPALAFSNPDAGPRTRIVVEADVYLPDPVFTPDPIYVFRLGAAAPPNLQYGLAMHAGYYRLMRNVQNNLVGTLNPQPPTNQWVHAVLGIDIGTPGNVTLDIGSSHAGGAAPTGVDGGTIYPGYVGVGGADLYVPQNGMRYYVDNVVVRWQ